MPLSRSQKLWGAGVMAFVLAAGAMISAYLVVKSRRHAAPADRAAAGPAGGAASPEVAVTVTARTCDPARLTVPAGKVTFRIVNQSSRVLEWEILQGVIVVDERENIAPGLAQKLTTTLQPGDYDITCGLLGNPRGKLLVTNAGGTTARQPAKPSPVQLIGPTAEYKVYVAGEADDLVTATQGVADAIAAGDLARAQALYAPARRHYQRIAPVAELFGDLDKTIDSRAADPDRKEDTPGPAGFPRIGHGLFSKKSTAGLTVAAKRLNADLVSLRSRLGTLSIPPDKMVEGAAGLVREMAAAALAGGEDGDLGLSGRLANLEGVRKIVVLLRPLTERADPALSNRIDADLAGAIEILARSVPSADGSEASIPLSPTDRDAFQGRLKTLTEDLSELRRALGLG